MPTRRHLIVIVGPTAIGKTALSLQMASYFDTEILSADSRQFYKEMNIGTAKPSPKELASVRHHFIDSHSIREGYSVGKYEEDAIQLLNELFLTKQVLLLLGGSGLYIKAICEGLDEMPETKPEIREQLKQQYQKEGLETLQIQLKNLDPAHYESVDLQNPHRVIRALEVCLSTGKPYSSFRTEQKTERDFQIHKIGLERPREELYQRIESRVDEMLAQGLLEEVKNLSDWKSAQALQTVGYTEIFGYLEGKYDWEEAIRLLKRNSRRYAKRQMTWFKKDQEIKWFHPSETATILAYLKSVI